MPRFGEVCDLVEFMEKSRRGILVVEDYTDDDSGMGEVVAEALGVISWRYRSREREI